MKEVKNFFRKILKHKQDSPSKYDFQNSRESDINMEDNNSSTLSSTAVTQSMNLKHIGPSVLLYSCSSESDSIDEESINDAYLNSSSALAKDKASRSDNREQSSSNQRVMELLENIENDFWGSSNGGFMDPDKIVGKFADYKLLGNAAGGFKFENCDI